ncbi:MAG: RNA polymerase sigma factor [Pirellulales bacterium]|nr:RNA polymerase sigma factor [Pirellulales bacterium]
MSSVDAAHVRQTLDESYRTDSRRVFATLVRLLGDFDLAEEALSDAYASAAQQWPREGVPANPRAWLVSAGRFKAIDAVRRRARFDASLETISRRLDKATSSGQDFDDEKIEDDRLRLIFTCCHPAIDPKVQVPLTLREVCGLTTEEIASAFLTAPATMAQRIVRGKAKIRDAGIPFAIPRAADFPERVASVLGVIYLVFNEGYAASSGDTLTRPDVSQEAIRLGRLLSELLPDPEVKGLLALMLLQESRREARATAEGDIILLEQQDRTKWDASLIAEGLELVERAIASRQFGAYTVQAAIAAVHASAKNAADTNWPQIVALYDALLAIHPSPVVELNRAVAVALSSGPEAGLALIEAILERGDLAEYHLAHAAAGKFNSQLGRREAARTAYERALALARQEPERRFLRQCLHELAEPGAGQPS